MFQAAAKYVSEALGFIWNSYLGQQKMTSSSHASSLYNERMNGSVPIIESLWKGS